jgi:hypothetical protein
MGEDADQYPGKKVVCRLPLPVGHEQAKYQQSLESAQYDDVFHTGQSYVVNITFGLTGLFIDDLLLFMMALAACLQCIQLVTINFYTWLPHWLFSADKYFPIM